MLIGRWAFLTSDGAVAHGKKRATDPPSRQSNLAKRGAAFS
jgi:hypothetical protein